MLLLEPRTSPWMKFFFIVLFAAIWNGITSVPVFTEIIPGFQKGQPEWGLTLFISIFVLVGLGTLAAAFYQLLAAFNPRPQLMLQRADLAPGVRSGLQWRFRGKASRIRHLQIILQGKEEATYSRGTDTYTDEHVFYSQTLVDTHDAREFRHGNTELEIPIGTMPSFDGGSNRIVWQIKLNGDIPRWPDVIEEFDVKVYPFSSDEV